MLDELDLASFVKTTASRGLHVVVPLRRESGFDAVREFAQASASLLASRYGDELTTEHREDKRRGCLYLDVGRNAYGQTAVAPYSVRALPGAPVATPIEWDEVEVPSLDARTFHTRNVLKRLAERGDAWQWLGRSTQSLSAARRLLDSVASSER